MKQVEVKIESDDIVVTDALRRFVEEKAKLVLSRNRALTDLKIELRLEDEIGPELKVSALGVAALGDQKIIASSVSKSPYSALGSMIHKLEHELTKARRSRPFKAKAVNDIGIAGKTFDSEASEPRFLSDKKAGSVDSLIVGAEVV